jgi:hypothetical protein
MAERHDARLAELVTELGGDEVRFRQMPIAVVYN